MSTEKLRLEVILAAVDKITGPLKAITKGSGDAARALRAAKDQLKDIEGQQKAIAAFKEADKAAAITANAFKGVQEQVKHLQREMAKTPEPTRAMIKALKDAQAESDTLKNRHAGLMDKQQRLFAQMKAGGIDTRNLANHSRDLSTRQLEAARAVGKLDDAMKAQNKTLSQMQAARANYDKSMANAASMRNAGMVAAAAGAAMSLPVVMATKDYATFEDAMLGVARQVNGARDANGKLTKTYYDMGDAIKAMSERIPMTTVEIAKIVAAGARMGIQGKENLLIYAQTAATMAHAFDLPVDEIGENMARIADLFHIPISRVGELGDAINWLDDNAKSKGGDIIEVMSRIAGSADMVKMSYRDAAAMGSTFLTLGARADVAATATNALIGQLNNAPMLATAKRYRVGLEMLKLSATDLQRGMNKDATGTILKVLDAIKALPQEKQLEATTRLFGKEYGDDVAKLAQNLTELRRQLKLVNDEEAKGSMQREADARKDALNARMTMAKNAFFNLSSDLGQHLKPAIAATLEKIVEIAQAVRAWARENPALASGIMTTVKWVSILVTVLGSGLIALAGVGAALAAIKFGLAFLNIAGITGVVVASIKAIGMAVLMSPLAPWVLLIGAVAAGIYMFWDPIKEFVGGIFTYVVAKLQAFHQWMQGIGERFRSLRITWSDIGEFIIGGIEAGIDARTFGLYSKIKTIAKNMAGLFGKQIEARSPSRVFARLGAFTMEGLELGIDAARKGPLGAMAAAAKQLTAAGAGLLIGGAAAAGGLPPIDMRPPIAAATQIGAGSGSSPIFNFHIYAAPGMDERALAQAVRREFASFESERAAGRRSRLVDSE